MTESNSYIPPLTISQMGRGTVYNNITETIGHTPLVRLNKIKQHFGLQSDILIKLEFFNPLASVKDRIGLAMIDNLINEGVIHEKTVMIEPTSGNTGIGLAFVAAARGLRLILVMPASMSIERRKMLTHLGAELVLSPADKGMKGALEKAAELLNQYPDSIMPSQFSNQANPAVHKATTAVEIWNDTNGQVDAIVAGVGTGGTITGCAQYWKKHKPTTKIVAVEPEDSPVLSGGEPGSHKIQGIGAGFVPKNLDLSIVDSVEQVSNEDAIEHAQMLMEKEGILAGISCGAALCAALRVAERPENKGKTTVVILPDSGERYLSSILFQGVFSEAENVQ